MQPFDLARALAGDKVVTRDGREVYQLKSQHSLSGACDLTGETIESGKPVTHGWFKRGNYLLLRPHDLDLFMAE